MALAATGKILFVDDEKRVLNSMRGMFRRDYELFLTTDGAEAVALAAANDIDVIVADQRMPGMTGVEVLEKVRERSPRTIRILLTGYADPAAIQGSINSGEVFRFLSKPCPPAILRETLTQAVAAARVSEANPPKVTLPDVPIPEAAPPPPAEPVPNVPDASESILSSEPGTAEESAHTATPNPPYSTPPGDDLDETGRNPTLIVPDAPLGDTQPIPVLSLPLTASVDEADAASTLPEQEEPDVTAMTDMTASRRMRVNAQAVGVVVFSKDRRFGESVHQIVSGDRHVTAASSVQEVADLLAEQQAGVLVTDATNDINLLQRLIGALKQHLPELVTIVVSDSRDADDMINLINYGQVYRFVVKPVDPLTLRTDINAAVLKHLQLLNHPELIQRHQVLDLSSSNAPSAMLNRLIGTVTRLRGLWSGSAAKSH